MFMFIHRSNRVSASREAARKGASRHALRRSGVVEAQTLILDFCDTLRHTTYQHVCAISA
jgi:hypothetical protein